ncbi:hypothetical protein [Kitasatospora sp. NPDC058190]|uniref:hypothetical protein n=1 Tax=Kitasatospora sp. NPDC058190 TaxID=3346371 RepID=UPI0036DA7D34
MPRNDQYYDKFAEWTDSGGEPEKVPTYDEMLDAISLYWLTGTGASSSRLYWEGAHAGGGPFNAVSIPKVPVAVTVLPAEIYPAPRSWGERTFGNIIHWNEVDKGGHFAAWEPPKLLAEELRNAFRTLRWNGAVVWGPPDPGDPLATTDVRDRRSDE